MKFVDENALRQNITETKDYVDNHGFASDRTPIGTIISVGCDSSLIPSSTIKYPTDDYFICKGTTLNIAEYPALADYFEDAFGSKNYFGGDGTTTFKVPDFTTDFPTNGILAIKAQMESTTITYADVDDTITTIGNVWSASKVNGEFSAKQTLIDACVSRISALETKAANKVLYFEDKACSAMTGNFCVVTDSRITADHRISEKTVDGIFSIPSAVTGDVTATYANGSITFNGTCTNGSCKASFTLIKKDN